jgi:hypothetical protein
MAKNDELEPNAVDEPNATLEVAMVEDNPQAVALGPDPAHVLAPHNEAIAQAHTDQDATETTRDDATDMGVPMLLGDPSEPQGPEDALGPGPKRGDYRGRVGPADYQPHQVIRNADGKIEVVAQRERVDDIDDAPGLKGGVDTVNPRNVALPRE